MYQRQKPQTSAKLFFTRLQRFQLLHAFRALREQLGERRIPANNFFESQEIPQESLSRPYDKRLPPINIKTLTQLPNNSSTYQPMQPSMFGEKREDLQTLESPALPTKTELRKKSLIYTFKH